LCLRGAIIDQSYGEHGFTCLYAAVKSGNVEMCKYLLENKVNPNPIMDIYEEAYHFVPLIEAVEKENVEIIKLLLDYNADPSFVSIDDVSDEYLISKNPELKAKFNE